MAILYRPHRGGLKAAMDEVVAFDTKEELKEHVQQHWKDLYPKCQIVFGRTDKDVDERIGWLTTYILSLETVGGSDGQHSSLLSFI